MLVAKGGSHWQSSDTLISEASALLWLNFCLKPQEKNHACSENGTLLVFIAGTSARFQETKGGRRLQSAHAAPRGSTRAAPIGQEVREAEILPLLASQSLRTQLCERGPSGFNLHTEPKLHAMSRISQGSMCRRSRPP